MKSRFNAYQRTLYEFINNVLVVCPVCGKQAIVHSKGYLLETDKKEIRLTCSHCGHSKYYSETPVLNNSSQNIIIGTNVDPYFHLPLWLSKDLPYGTLWAYNYEHLNFIEQHIAADLRERDAYLNDHHSIGVRLPKWMTSKKNREDILHELEKLRKK